MVSLARSKETGQSKGFGFVTFYSVQEAECFARAYPCGFFELDGKAVTFDFKEELEDWQCIKVKPLSFS